MLPALTTHGRAYPCSWFCCAATIASRNKFPWAKVPVAKIIGKMYEMRYSFAADNKAQVERWQRMVLAAATR